MGKDGFRTLWSCGGGDSTEVCANTPSHLDTNHLLSVRPICTISIDSDFSCAAPPWSRNRWARSYSGRRLTITRKFSKPAATLFPRISPTYTLIILGWLPCWNLIATKMPFASLRPEAMIWRSGRASNTHIHCTRLGSWTSPLMSYLGLRRPVAWTTLKRRWYVTKNRNL